MIALRERFTCRSCGLKYWTYIEMMECPCLANPRCYICGDEDDHDGIPHGIATGDNRTRADKDREDEQAWAEEPEDLDPRCACEHLRHHGHEPDKRCSNRVLDVSTGGLCVPCVFGCGA